MDTDKTTALKQRTKQFALEIIKSYKIISKSEGKLIGRQLLRSASSMAANYRAACRARSKAEFFAKLSIVVEESDESVFGLKYWKKEKFSMQASWSWIDCIKKRLSCTKSSPHPEKQLKVISNHQIKNSINKLMAI